MPGRIKLKQLHPSGASGGDVPAFNAGTQDWEPTTPGAPGAHASTHVSGATDEIDGDILDIDFTPTNYTPDTSPAEVTLVDELTAHLKGIDNAITGGPSEQAIVQARRTTTLAFPSSWADVTFDTTDVETDSAVLDHQLGTNDDRILIGETGNYLIGYALTGNQVGADLPESRLTLNDGGAAIAGMADIWGPTHTGAGGNHTVRLGRIKPISLTSGDFLSLQIQNTDTGGTMSAGAIFFAIRLTGKTGPKGDPGSGGAGFPRPLWAADALDFPLNADWAINAMAGQAPDTNNAGIKVRLHDDTVEEGTGFEFRMPSTAVNMKLLWSARAETAPGGAVVARWNLRFRRTAGGVAVAAWSAAIQLADQDFGTNEFFEDDEDERTFASWGLTAGHLYQFQLTRDATDGADTLVGDAALSVVGLEFSD